MSNKNVVRLVDPSSIDDMVCISIGEELIEKEGDGADAIHAYPMHAAEIILTEVLMACRAGESARQIEKRLIGLAVAFEEGSM